MSEAAPHPHPHPQGVSLSIWPPSQRTRDAVTSRLVETLSSESVLSKRYGTVPKDEAGELAKKIEEEAFLAAGGDATKPDDDGMDTLQVYSKAISQRILEAVKFRSAGNETRDVPEDDNKDHHLPPPPPPADADEPRLISPE